MQFRVQYLWNDNKLARLGVHGLDQTRHGDVAKGDALDMTDAVDRGDVLIGQGEEDVGLRLGASFWCYLSTRGLTNKSVLQHIIDIYIHSFKL